MDQGANTPDSEVASQPGGSEPWQGVVIVSLLVGFMIFGPLFAFGWLAERMSCVEMPNGFLIGRATVFSSMYHTEQGLPDIAIRYPDGRLFARGDNTMDFWDEDGFGGRFDQPRLRQGGYIYLNDVGLITDRGQPGLYRSYFDKKMQEHKDSRQTSGGHVMRTYLLLRESSNNHKNWCKTDWFLPNEAR